MVKKVIGSIDMSLQNLQNSLSIAGVALLKENFQGFLEEGIIHFSLAAVGNLYENGKCHGCVPKKKKLQNVKRREAGISSYDK